MDNNSFDAENHTPRASLSSVTVFKDIWVVIFVHRLKSIYNFGVFFWRILQLFHIILYKVFKLLI